MRLCMLLKYHTIFTTVLLYTPVTLLCIYIYYEVSMLSRLFSFANMYAYDIAYRSFLSLVLVWETDILAM